MKKAFIFGLILSCGVSAKSVCFQNNLESPISIDMSVENRAGKTTLQRYEFVPQQYFCNTYSDITTKRLQYKIHSSEIACAGEFIGRGRFILIANLNGCQVVKE